MHSWLGSMQPPGSVEGVSTDPLAQIVVAAILIGLFALLALEAAHRLLVALGAVALLWLVSYLTPLRLTTFESTASSLDLNVIVLLAAMMALVGVLRSTGVFEWAVARLMAGTRGRPLLVLSVVCWFTAVASALLDNVTTVIFVTPMAIGMARRLAVPAPAFLLPMVMASNIGGSATLIGDPPNIMIGSGADIPFMEFIYNLAVPCTIMMIWTQAFAERRYRRELASARDLGAAPAARIPSIENPLLLRWLAGIGFAVLLGFVTQRLTGMPVAVPATIGAVAALLVQDVLYLRAQRPSAHERIHGVLRVTERDIEWPTLAFFGGLFIVVGGAVQTGLIGSIAGGLEWAIDHGRTSLGLSPAVTLLFAAVVVVWVSGFLSAIIDNIPFVAVAIPIVAQLSGRLEGDTSVLWWALALGACLGGNGTAIGASANVTTIGLAEREGIRITFGDFSRFGARVTAGTLILSSLFVASHIFLGARPTALYGLGILAVLALWRRLRRAAARAAPLPNAGESGSAD
jgi:Na+/H+ antiporter NhaD/arsenite permease-like protein